MPFDQNEKFLFPPPPQKLETFHLSATLSPPQFNIFPPMENGGIHTKKKENVGGKNPTLTLLKLFPPFLQWRKVKE